MRAMNAGDMAFFYHSNIKTPGIVGTMEIVREFSEDSKMHSFPYYLHLHTHDLQNPPAGLAHHTTTHSPPGRRRGGISFMSSSAANSRCQSSSLS